MCPRGERTLLLHIAYAIAAVLTAFLGRLSWWETSMCELCFVAQSWPFSIHELRADLAHVHRHGLYGCYYDFIVHRLYARGAL